MDKHLKKRILGAVVTVVALAVALPVVIDGSRQQLPIGDDMQPMPPMPDWTEVENQQRIRIDLEKLARGEPQNELLPPAEEAVVNVPDAIAAAAAEELAAVEQPAVTLPAEPAEPELPEEPSVNQAAQPVAGKTVAEVTKPAVPASPAAGTPVASVTKPAAPAAKPTTPVAGTTVASVPAANTGNTIARTPAQPSVGAVAAATPAAPAAPPVVSKPAAASNSPGATDASGLPYAWIIQIGAFSQQANGESVRDRLRRDGFKAYSSTESDGLTRVYVGPEVSEAEAERVRVRLQLALDRGDLRLKRYVPR